MRVDKRRRRESVALADAGVADVASPRHEKPSAGFHGPGDGDQRQIALTDNFRIISAKVFEVVTGQPFGIAEMHRQIWLLMRIWLRMENRRAASLGIESMKKRIESMKKTDKASKPANAKAPAPKGRGRSIPFWTLH